MAAEGSGPRRQLHRGLPLLLLAALVAAGLQSPRCTGARSGAMTEARIDDQQLQPARAPAEFAARAYAHVAELVSYGPRWTGSPGWAKALDYIAATLRERAGLEPERDRWTDPRFGITFENISVTVPGDSPHRIVIACHHDTKKCEGHPLPEHNFHFVGANDSGSGVGLLLALAEAWAKRRGPATLQLVFFDGEECLDFKWDTDRALFGSKRFVARERERPFQPSASQVRAMVLLDMVGDRDLSIDEESYSDKDLRALFRAAAKACGHEAHFFRERLPIKDDHLPFLDAGIPAIDLIDFVGKEERWHTALDTLEHISADSLRIVGEAVLTALPAIEQRWFPPRERLQLPERR